MGSLVSTTRPCHTSQSSFNRHAHLRSHSSRDPVGFTPKPHTFFERKQIPHQQITKHKQETNPNQAAAHQPQHRTALKPNEHAPNSATKHEQANSTPTPKTSPESSHNTTLKSTSVKQSHQHPPIPCQHFTERQSPTCTIILSKETTGVTAPCHWSENPVLHI